MTGERFLQFETLKILALGVTAFGIATAAGVLMAKLMNLFARKNPINPLIGLGRGVGGCRWRPGCRRSKASGPIPTISC